MSDERLRTLERRWRETERSEDERAWLLERVRTGELSRDAFVLARLLGHSGCQTEGDAFTPQDRREWVRIGILFARHVGWALDEAQVGVFLRLLKRVQLWLKGGRSTPSGAALKRDVERWTVGTDHVYYSFEGAERLFAYSVLFVAEAVFVRPHNLPEQWSCVLDELDTLEERAHLVNAVLGTSSLTAKSVGLPRGVSRSATHWFGADDYEQAVQQLVELHAKLVFAYPKLLGKRAEVGRILVAVSRGSRGDLERLRDLAQRALQGWSGVTALLET